MYLKNTKSHLLVRVLRKQGWNLLQEAKVTWLVKDSYHVELQERGFKLYCNVNLGDSLVHVETLHYGRRQSQNLRRAVEKHKKETQKCMTTSSGTKGELRR